MNNELRNELKKAIELKNSGQDHEAVELLKETEIRYGVSPQSTGLISMILYHNLGNLNESFKFALKWTEISPESEKASINLVHILFDLNKHNELEKEISRFIKTGVELDIYNELFEENGLSKKDFS